MHLTDKCLNEIKDVEEGAISEPEYRGKRVRALLRIDASNEEPLSQHESEYFYMLNKHNLPTNLKRVEVKVDADSEEIHEVVRRRLNQGCCR